MIQLKIFNLFSKILSLNYQFYYKKKKNVLSENCYLELSQKKKWRNA